MVGEAEEAQGHAAARVGSPVVLEANAGIGVPQVQGIDGLTAPPGNSPGLVAGNLEAVASRIMFDPGKAGVHRRGPVGQIGAVDAGKVVVGVGKLPPDLAARLEVALQGRAGIGRRIPVVAVAQSQFQQARLGPGPPRLPAPFPVGQGQVGGNILAVLAPNSVAVPVYPYPPVGIGHDSPSSPVLAAVPWADPRRGAQLQVVIEIALSCRNRASKLTCWPTRLVIRYARHRNSPVIFRRPACRPAGP